MMGKRELAVVLGIRPDIIRASIILNLLQSDKRANVRFIWSGQHYSENLKDIFFRQLNVRAPDIELNAGGETDSEIVASVIRKLYDVLRELRPTAAVFLGDNNTTMGCLAAAQLNIPIVHVEGCMRSYDWRMPEEKYRLIVDHLSDIIYAYLDEYKQQGIAEGLSPQAILVTGNPIVDVLQKFYYARQDYYGKLGDERFFARRNIRKREYYLMTCHRRENVEDPSSLKSILELVGEAGRMVYFPASYRTQKALKAASLRVPDNVKVTDPVGYDEFLVLITNSLGVFSDSGTVIEEACVLNIPSVQLRKSTERPQVYDVGASVKFDPTAPDQYSADRVLAKLRAIQGRSWSNPFGDGRASERIASDLLQKLEKNDFGRHKPADYPFDIGHSFREDALDKLLPKN
jgi:UDP-N-acetylglucosamine 2-epimerase